MWWTHITRPLLPHARGSQQGWWLVVEAPIAQHEEDTVTLLETVH